LIGGKQAALSAASVLVDGALYSPYTPPM
jgi:hypothetical protein